MRHHSRAALLAAAGITSLALVTACGSSGSGSGSSGSAGTSGAPSPAATAPAAPGSAGTPAPSGAATLSAATDAKLGAIVTDSAGFTLYRFDKDTTQPPASHCDGSCATLWPPVAATGQTSVKGIDGKLVGTVTRADGSKQLTLDGRPLYRYAPDTKPGDTTGQGVGGVWFAVTPTGAKAGTTTPAQSTTPTMPPATGPGGYGY
ncbi:hypothetical protein [Kitasatospora sp. NBC_00315]|uniref:hypothetical protein n=1 Tax=Kitasatospora sp. NBC_00315 TaxID=2975963 RepID=UPI0032464478